MFQLALLVIFWLYLCGVAEALDSTKINGVWTGTIHGPYEEAEFLDVFYLEGDYLYTLGNSICGYTENYIRYKRIENQIFSLEEPFDCYGITFLSGTISFSGSDQVSIYMELEEDDLSVKITGNGNKLQDERVPLNSYREIAGAEDSVKVFSIEVPPNVSFLEVQTYGGSGDNDLYVVYHKPPYYFESSEGDYTDEYIYIDNPSEGIWYIIVYGFESYRNVTLDIYADYSQASPTPISPPVSKPLADIMLDYSDTYLAYSSSDAPLITLYLEPQDYNGYPADWWLILGTHSGIKYFDLASMSFKEGLKVTYQGNLFPIYFFDLTKIDSLPPGDYVIYFGVDLNQNGQLDINSLIYDFIIFSVKY